MKALLSLGLLAYSLTALAAPGTNQVKVVWDANVEPACTGYLVLWGTRSQSYGNTNEVNGRLNTTALLTNLPHGVIYVVAQATADDGQVSAYSNEVLWTNGPPAAPVVTPPLSPPRNIQIRATIQGSASIFGPWTDIAWVQTGGSASNVYRTVLVKEEIIP